MELIKNIIIALISGSIGAIISYFLSIRQLNKGFKRENKRKYIENLITFLTTQIIKIKSELEILKQTKRGKTLQEREESYEKRIREREDEQIQFLIQEDISSLYFDNLMIKKELTNFYIIGTKIFEKMTEYLKTKSRNKKRTKNSERLIKEIEKNLEKIQKSKHIIIALSKQELK